MIVEVILHFLEWMLTSSGLILVCSVFKCSLFRPLLIISSRKTTRVLGMLFPTFSSCTWDVSLLMDSQSLNDYYHLSKLPTLEIYLTVTIECTFITVTIEEYPLNRKI